jgi:hypothetical protein
MLIRQSSTIPVRGYRAAILLLPLSLLLCAACAKPESDAGPGAATGEAQPGARACTMIGCENGVTVQLASVPAVPFSVELTPTGGAPTIKECTAATACGSELFFAGVSADSVTVKVTSPAGESVTRAKAEYAVTRPNGPQCDPECRQARVTATVPR